uniref:Uncharacterized protein n=1 Tax=Corethron hystrix TaxID=216773 RepID=A0A7S1BMA9_9STRA|mmetsp:Transcript_34032/g.78535  ORF Transcript_34032/g.78535 Transcript_34032/m.78535 type:complete len:327 (+) Transcript_34032:524-1504(+)
MVAARERYTTERNETTAEYETKMEDLQTEHRNQWTDIHEHLNQAKERCSQQESELQDLNKKYQTVLNQLEEEMTSFERLTQDKTNLEETLTDAKQSYRRFEAELAADVRMLQEAMERMKVAHEEEKAGKLKELAHVLDSAHEETLAREIQEKTRSEATSLQKKFAEERRVLETKLADTVSYYEEQLNEARNETLQHERNQSRRNLESLMNPTEAISTHDPSENTENLLAEIRCLRGELQKEKNNASQLESSYEQALTSTKTAQNTVDRLNQEKSQLEYMLGQTTIESRNTIHWLNNEKLVLEKKLSQYGVLRSSKEHTSPRFLEGV